MHLHRMDLGVAVYQRQRLEKILFILKHLLAIIPALGHTIDLARHKVAQITHRHLLTTV